MNVNLIRLEVEMNAKRVAELRRGSLAEADERSAKDLKRRSHKEPFVRRCKSMNSFFIVHFLVIRTSLHQN